MPEGRWLSINDIAKDRVLQARHRITSRDLELLREQFNTLTFVPLLCKAGNPKALGYFIELYAEVGIRMAADPEYIEIRESILPKMLELARERANKAGREH